MQQSNYWHQFQRLNEDITADIWQNRTIPYALWVQTRAILHLLKTHKPGNPGSTVVLSYGHCIERMSRFVDYHFQPLTHELPFFVKDNNNFLNKLLTIGNFPANFLLITRDVSSIYNTIPHNEGINAGVHFFTYFPS